MEWIETTGKTVEEAKQRALQELGIDESELEFEVVQEPRTGLLGRLSGSTAHVRARVRPVSREKPDRRRRGQGGRERRGGRGGGRSGRAGGERGGEHRGEPAARQGRERGGRSGGRGRERERERPAREGNGRRGERAGSRAGSRADMGESEERVMSDVPIEDQVKVAQDFTQGLVDTFGLDAGVRVTSDDEDHLRVEVEGDGVGVLIGRNGSTMEAIRELIKTALQRQTEGHNARVSIDVGGYAAQRREALAAFARQLAQKAVDSGRAQVLEPMSPPDRKVVHDAVNEIEGVTTVSQGEEPRRRVIIQPS